MRASHWTTVTNQNMEEMTGKTKQFRSIRSSVRTVVHSTKTSTAMQQKSMTGSEGANALSKKCIKREPLFQTKKIAGICKNPVVENVIEVIEID